MRSHYCGNINNSDIGSNVEISGWVHKRRDHGGVIFLDIRDLYDSFYKDSPNVSIMKPGDVPDIKSIANTNNCHISVNHSNIANQVVVISSIDNLVKGAAGQAVECYNLMNGFDQSTGLVNV